MIDAKMSFNMPSNARFGWFFSGIFAMAALYYYSQQMSIVAGFLSIVFVVCVAATIAFPQALMPLNRIWYQFGILIGKLVNPIILGIIFFMLITPMSILMRMFGRDELKIKKSRRKSYWVERIPAGPAPESFNNQY